MGGPKQKHNISLISLVAVLLVSGCLQENTISPPSPPDEPSLPDGIFVTGPDGLNVSDEPLLMDFVFSDVGEQYVRHTLYNLTSY